MLHPLAMLSPHTNEENSLNELDEKWETLIQEIENFDPLKGRDEMSVAKLNVKLGALHLVQPFNWNAWGADFPTREQIALLPLADCVRHITRLVRLNRFAEGVLANAVASGDLLALCNQARNQAKGERIPNVIGPDS